MGVREEPRGTYWDREVVTVRPPTTDGRRITLPDHLEEHLSDWIDSGLLDPGVAQRIRDLEQARLVPRRIPAAAEIVGYLGALLVLAAGGSLYAQQWSQMGHWIRVAAPAVAAVAALFSGVALIRTAEPSFRRLGAVLWMLSVGLAAGATAVAVNDISGGAPDHALFVIGVVSLVYSAVLYGFCKHATTQFAMFAAVVATLAGGVAWASPRGPNAQFWFVLPLVAIGLAWITAGAVSALAPRTTALVLGSVVALYVPQFLFGTDAQWAGFVIGLAVAVGLLAASTWLRSTHVLALSAIGLFGYLVGVIARYLSDTVGAPLALLLSGIVLIVVALGASRLQRFTRRASTRAAGPDGQGGTRM